MISDNFIDLVANAPTPAIKDAFIKTKEKICDSGYQNIVVSISGGSDSDIMLDMIERIGYKPGTVVYVWFDTGMEYEATKRHLLYLEDKYNINIIREKAYMPVPLGIKKYGVPFLNKSTAYMIHTLQNNGFKWEDKSYEELRKEYPKITGALKWWCNEYPDKSRWNINRQPYLKEYMIQSPPHSELKISEKCCNGAKKKTSHLVIQKFNADLDVIGVRKAEGGFRAFAYTSCFDKVENSADKFRPIYYLTNTDKRLYEETFKIIHSDCYSVYGFKRTGCVCCPFGTATLEHELAMIQKYEPKLYQLCNAVFGESYEYTRKFLEFKKEMKELNKK